MAALGLAGKVERLHRGLSRSRIPHAFGGALALAYYTTPRATVDIDVNVFTPPDEFAAVARVLRRIGVDEIPPTAAAVRDGQVRARWGSTPVDLFFSYNEVHEAMRLAVRTVPFGKATIPILAPEHLLLAKVIFDRSKDWLDIEQMLVAVSDLDLGEVEKGLEHVVGKTDPRAERFRELALRTRGE